jgi:Tfp pilus assembly protein PilO
MALTKREQKISFFAAFIITCGVIYLGIYMPFKKENAFLDSQLAALHKDVRSLRRSDAKDKARENQYALLIAEHKQQGSEGEVMSALLSEIESAAGQWALHINEMKPRKPKKQYFYNSFSVSLSVEGGLTDILDFILLLQNAPYNLNVDEFVLIRGSPIDKNIRAELVLSRLLVP